MVQYSGIYGAYSPQKRSCSLKILFLMLGSMIGFFFCTIKHSLLPMSPKTMTQVATPTKELSFSCFSRLPLELRNKIWQLTFEGRTVTLHVHTFNQSCYYRSSIPRGIKITLDLVQANMPKTLRVNRESRKVTLSQYKDLIKNPALFRDPVYFNSDLDTMALEVYYPTRPGKGYSWVRQKGARNHQKISLDLRDLAERAPNVLKMVKSLYLPMIMLDGEPATTYEGVLPTCWNGMVQFHELELVTITGIESDFQHGIPVAYAKSAAKYFQSSFEKEKNRCPDCHVPRLNMFPLDDDNEKATGSNDYFRFTGDARFEDDIVGGSWNLWFQEPENSSVVNSGRERYDGGFVQESIQDIDAIKNDEKRRNHTSEILRATNDGVTVASEFNNSRWSTEGG
ncbi:uncharacterized protein Bfra_001221 [Botrytis fragariae]|uniref:2EXR domain-containing protein n=1 Tax=Botrytis fragariae TaxID=1964551 RepID=A0A8H6AZZ1_9HELO|nr:uncharacterized protein Bfra_001221 [Botrytis fragariae]KAF5876866.1 hypothetical protein Bfra_001221 [Botrytis fragariae]